MAEISTRSLPRMVAIGIVTTIVIVAGACSTNGVQTPEQSSSSYAAAMNRLASDCLDTWLNTLAPQSAIDDGLIPVTDGQSQPEPIITQNPDGSYHAHPERGGFDQWEMRNRVPYTDIQLAILNGTGCPYTTNW